MVEKGDNTYLDLFAFSNIFMYADDEYEQGTFQSLLKVQISAHRPKIFANKCLISKHLIVINENRGLLGRFKTTPMLRIF